MSAAAATARMTLSIMLAAAALYVAGCSKTMTPRERALAEQQNAMNAQIESDWQNVVNEARPVMAVVNQYDAMSRNAQVEEQVTDAANLAGGK